MFAKINNNYFGGSIRIFTLSGFRPNHISWMTYVQKFILFPVITFFLLLMISNLQCVEPNIFEYSAVFEGVNVYSHVILNT